jgi:hypothetical protein
MLRHGLDVVDFWAGRITVRRMSVIVGQLLADPGSALVRSIRDGEVPWTSTDYLLADVFDLIAAANFKDPKPYPRPGDEKRAQELEDNRRRAQEEQRERIRQRERALAEGSNGG